MLYTVHSTTTEFVCDGTYAVVISCYRLRDVTALYNAIHSWWKGFTEGRSTYIHWKTSTVH